jgi:hypothetical protein
LKRYLKIKHRLFVTGIHFNNQSVSVKILLIDAGGPLLLMELAFLLRHVGSQVVWITNQRSEETNDVTYSLEHKMLNHGVQV